MTRSELEHLLRAAGDTTDDDERVVVGSQAILGPFPVAADLYPRHRLERAELIDGSIGEFSPFHLTFGYYAQGVGPKTAVLPAGWEARLVVVENANTRGIRGLCLEVHDLVVAKLVAGREKDSEFAAAAVRHELANVDEIHRQLAGQSLRGDRPRQARDVDGWDDSERRHRRQQGQLLPARIDQAAGRYERRRPCRTVTAQCRQGAGGVVRSPTTRRWGGRLGAWGVRGMRCDIRGRNRGGRVDPRAC